ncbi:MAG: AtpZ/AtpI family protein [Lachnospiraceae bacterium]|nr:AtpZ/AtpI family protein [Lachnospiraceae bacterium]
MKKRTLARCLTMITQVSLTLLSPIILCTAIGVWLDNHFGWSTTVVLLILGILSGGRSAYVLVLKMLKEVEKESTYDR